MLRKLYVYIIWVLYLMFTASDRMKYATAKREGTHVSDIKHGSLGSTISYDTSKSVEDNKTFMNWEEFKEVHNGVDVFLSVTLERDGVVLCEDKKMPKKRILAELDLVLGERDSVMSWDIGEQLIEKGVVSVFDRKVHFSGSATLIPNESLQEKAA